MIEYRVRLVGDPMGPWLTVVARNPDEAIAQAAGCNGRYVTGPSYRPRVGTERYMPHDGSERQWEIEDTRLAPIIAMLSREADGRALDAMKVGAIQIAVDEVVKATGMVYADARRLVRGWFETMESPQYDARSLHADAESWLDTPKGSIFP